MGAPGVLRGDRVIVPRVKAASARHLYSVLLYRRSLNMHAASSLLLLTRTIVPQKLLNDYARTNDMQAANLGFSVPVSPRIGL